MSEKQSNQRPTKEGWIQTNDRQLPPVKNSLPMPKVQPPKKD